jgi:hypothetical protein
MPYREFIVHQDLPGEPRRVHIVRITSEQDRYVATAFRTSPDGTRTPLVLRGERDATYAPDLFYERRRIARRALAMLVTQALQANLYDAASEGHAPTELSIGANLAGYPGGYPEAAS